MVQDDMARILSAASCVSTYCRQVSSVGRASDSAWHNGVLGGSSPGWDHRSLGWKYHSNERLQVSAHSSHQRNI